MNRITRSACLIVVANSLALAGCGGEDPAAAAKEPPVRHIYTSSVDCADAGIYRLDDCSEAIARAVNTHEKNAPTYRKRSLCESKEGAGRCERISDADFRPRLVAFVFEGKEKPFAKPLYPASGGFRTADNANLLKTNDYLKFTKSARDAADLYGKGGPKKTAKSAFE